MISFTNKMFFIVFLFNIFTRLFLPLLCCHSIYTPMYKNRE
ncbi:hypothetical protein EGD00_04165 [Pectobacterium carotovorum subsp. carotovorum]|nr:hypothetical protein EGD00_04165 [Pectobacterium carotovorum subsp. carotovorum]